LSGMEVPAVLGAAVKSPKPASRQRSAFIGREAELFVGDAGDPAGTTFRIQDAVSTFVVEASLETPVLLVLDDLHWADESSLGLLVFLARELGKAHLLLLGTYRDVELGGAYPLARTLGALAREKLYQRQKLRGWREEETARFMEQEGGSPAGLELVQKVQELTDGNPLFCREMARVALTETEGRLPARLPKASARR